MESKKRINQLTIVAAIFFVVFLFLSGTIKNGICGDTDLSCLRMEDSIGTPIFLFSVSIFILCVLLRWLSAGFHAWLRFAKYYIPVAALLIIASPSVATTIFGFDKEFMSWLLAGTFFVVSVVLVVYKQPRTKE